MIYAYIIMFNEFYIDLGVSVMWLCMHYKLNKMTRMKC